MAVLNNENTDNVMFLLRNFYSSDGWSSKLEVYKNVYKKLVGLDMNDQPTEKILTLRVHVGDFYVVEDWNIDSGRKESIPYQIDLNYREIPFLDSMKKEVAKKDFKIDVNKNLAAYNAFLMRGYDKANLTCYIDPNTMKSYTANEAELKENVPTSYHYFKKGDIYLKKTRAQSNEARKFMQTLVSMNQFNGLFKIVGEAYTRNRVGEDQHFQIEIPKCKMQTSNGFNLSTDGEPNTVDMSFTATPDYKGDLVYITSYEEEHKDEHKEYYTRPILTQAIPTSTEELRLSILYPTTLNGGTNPGILCIPKDCRVENRNNESRLVLPTTSAAAQQYHTKILQNKWSEIPKDLLLVGVYSGNNLVKYLTRNDNCTITVKNLETEQR